MQQQGLPAKLYRTHRANAQFPLTFWFLLFPALLSVPFLGLMQVSFSVFCLCGNKTSRPILGGFAFYFADQNLGFLLAPAPSLIWGRQV